MGVSLKKGEGVSLSKDNHDLDEVTVGLGWDVAERKSGGLLGGLFGKKAPDYDLDAIAFLLDHNGKIANLGDVNNGSVTLINGDVVFFNSMRHPSGCVWLTGDNRTGAGDGDDEQIIVRLNSLPPQFERIVFIVAIYQGIKNGQSFGGVKNAYIRAVDRRGKELARFDISGNASLSTYRSLTFAEVVRQGAAWTFRAIGTPHETDRFVDILRGYI